MTRTNHASTTRPAPRPSTATAAGSRLGRTSILLAAVASALAAGAALLLLGGGGGADGTDYSCGSARIVAADLSSQNRSDRQVALTADVVSGHVVGAAVCQEPLTVVGVADGTPVLIPIDQHVMPELVGPNARARAQVAREHADAIRSAVVETLETTYDAYPEVETTSMPAIYDAVAAHARAGARIVILTTGVHDTPAATLNRPLADGEGRSMAKAMTWPELPTDATVTVIGIAQVDSEVPAPGELWPREVTAFGRAACEASGAGRCELFQVAGLDKAQL